MVGLVDQLGYQTTVVATVYRVGETGVRAQLADVLDRLRGEIVEEVDSIAATQQCFGEMRADEPRASCDQYSQLVLLRTWIMDGARARGSTTIKIDAIRGYPQTSACVESNEHVSPTTTSVLHVLVADDWAGTEVQVAELVARSEAGGSACRHLVTILAPKRPIGTRLERAGHEVTFLHGAGGQLGGAVRLAQLLHRRRPEVVEA